MKTKKMIYRVVSAAMCLTLLGAGAQVFAATSDSYTGYSTTGAESAKVTCKINGFDNPLPWGKDSCKASTEVLPDGVQANVLIALYNENYDIIRSSGWTNSKGKIEATIEAYDNNSTKYAMSTHSITSDDYGVFVHMLVSEFN